MTAEQKLIKSTKLSVKIKSLHADGLNINYIETGSGDPIIFLHGLNIGWGMWYQNLSSLSKKFKIYAIDLPGAGNSSDINYQTYDVDKYISILKQFLKLNNISKPIIIGHSFGGFLGAKLALDKKSQVRKLVLINPMGFTDYIPRKFFILSFPRVVSTLTKTLLKPTKKFITSFLLNALFKKSALKNDFLNYYLESLKHSGRHPLNFMSSMVDKGKISSSLLFDHQTYRLKIPKLVIFGSKDPLFPYKSVTANIKKLHNSIIHVYKNSGHVPPIEESAKLNKQILEFLSSNSN